MPWSTIMLNLCMIRVAVCERPSPAPPQVKVHAACALPLRSEAQADVREVLLEFESAHEGGVCISQEDELVGDLFAKGYTC